jgi:hypothetical protein
MEPERTRAIAAEFGGMMGIILALLLLCVAEIERWSCMESRLVATSEVDGANPSAM